MLYEPANTMNVLYGQWPLYSCYCFSTKSLPGPYEGIPNQSSTWLGVSHFKNIVVYSPLLQNRVYIGIYINDRWPNNRNTIQEYNFESQIFFFLFLYIYLYSYYCQLAIVQSYIQTVTTRRFPNRDGNWNK